MDKANVVSVQTNEQKRQSWKAGLIKAGAVASAVVASSQASAFEIGTILEGSGASENSDAIAVFVLGVVIILFTLGMARRGLGK